MRSALLQKTAADLRTRAGALVLLAVVVAVAGATLTISFTVERSTTRTTVDLLEGANGADVWFFSPNAEFLSSLEQRIPTTATSAVSPRQSSGRLASAVDPRSLTFLGWEPAEEAVQPFVLTEGRWHASASEAVIDRGLARIAAVEIGDSVEVVVGPLRRTFTVTGLGIPTLRAPYPLWEPAMMLVSVAALEDLAGGTQGFTVGLQLPGGQDAVLGAVRAASLAAGREGVPLGNRSTQLMIDSIGDEASATVILLGTFAAFALVAAGFVIANTVAGQAHAHRRDLGTLKAAGFTPAQVTAVTLTPYLLVGTAAAATGLAAGFFASSIFLRRIEDLLGTAAPPSIGIIDVLVIFTLVMTIVLLSALVPSWRASRGSTVDALRQDGGRSNGRDSRLSRLARMLKLPSSIVIGVKDTFTHRWRAWLTISALAVAAAAMMAAATVEATVSNIFDDPVAAGGDPFHLLVEINEVDAPDDGPAEFAVSHDEIIAFLEADRSVESYITQQRPSITITGVGYGSRAVGGPVESMPYPIVEGRMFSGAREAVIGVGLARTLDLGVGDSVLVTVLVGDRVPRVFDIVGVYAEGSNNGQMMMFSLDALRRWDNSIPPGTIGVRLTDAEQAAAFTARLLTHTDDAVAVENLSAEFEEENRAIRDQIRRVLVPLSAFLLVMVAVNLMAGLMMSVRERRREIGVLKTVGMTPRQITAGIISGAVVLSVIGSLIGAPAGWAIMRLLLGWATRDEGLPDDFVQVPGLGWFGVVILLGVTFAVIGAAWPAMRASRAVIADAVRLE